MLNTPRRARVCDEGPYTQAALLFARVANALASLQLSHI